MENTTYMDDNNTFVIEVEISNFTNVTEETSGTSLTNEELLHSLILKYASKTYSEHYYIIFPMTFVFCLIGLVTNSINIAVFTRKSMLNAVNLILTALSVSNILLMLTQIAYPIHYFCGFSSMFKYGFEQFNISLVFAETLTLLLCNWFAVSVAVWMFIAIQLPLRARVLCSMFRTKILLLVIVLCSILVTIPIYFILHLDEYDLFGGKLYAKGFSEFAKFYDGIYMKVFWGGILLVVLIPSVLLVFVTVMLIGSLILFNIRRKKRFTSSLQQSKPTLQENHNYRIASMLSVFLVLFILNNLPDAAIVVASFYNKESHDATKSATDWLRPFSMLYNALTFFIYYFMGVNYRKTFKEIFYPKKQTVSFNNGTSGTNSTSTGRKDSIPELAMSRVDTNASTAQMHCKS